MKVQVHINPQLDEPVIYIQTPDPNHPLIQKIEALTGEMPLNQISLLIDDSWYPVPIQDIIRIYTEDRHVYVETMEQRGVVRQRLSWFAEQLKHKGFVQINQGEIINCYGVEKMTVGFNGAIQVFFKNKKSSFVSRRMLRNFKSALNL